MFSTADTELRSLTAGRRVAGWTHDSPHEPLEGPEGVGIVGEEHDHGRHEVRHAWQVGVGGAANKRPGLSDGKRFGMVWGGASVFEGRYPELSIPPVSSTLLLAGQAHCAPKLLLTQVQDKGWP